MTDDIAEFARKVFGFELLPHQIEIIRAIESGKRVVSGRVLGKQAMTKVMRARMLMTDKKLTHEMIDEIVARHGPDVLRLVETLTREGIPIESVSYVLPQGSPCGTIYGITSVPLTLLPLGPDPRPKTILDEANELVLDRRQRVYGDPVENWSRTAQMFTAYLGHPISARQASDLMILVKMSRLAQGYHEDSYRDVAGYAWVGDHVGNKPLEHEG